MKTILEINTTNYGSTGKIMLNIAKEARANGYNVYTCCKNSRSSKKFNFPNHFYIGTRIDRVISERIAYYTGYKNYFNIINTFLFIIKIKKIKPDLIHLHAIGEPFLNMNMFTNFIKKSKTPIVWTLHAGWPITGGCAFFALVNCEKWKSICSNCPLLKFERISKIDRTSFMQKKKKQWFSGINNMTIVTPSKWLASIINDSFLSQYPIKVINNGIDLNIYKYTKSSFKEEYKINDRYIVLGLAYMWNERKGIQDFLKLTLRLPEKYVIVMVGHIDNNINLPKSIIHIEKTYNQIELVKIYSAADIFVNPTYEDNFPTVNIEALACGLPVLTYNTGGSPEIIDNTCGDVVKKGDVELLTKKIINICENKLYKKEDCIKKSKQYDSKSKFLEYINLYNSILNNNHLM